MSSFAPSSDTCPEQEDWEGGASECDHVPETAWGTTEKFGVADHLTKSSTKDTYGTFRGPGVSSQHPHYVAHNHLYLQI